MSLSLPARVIVSPLLLVFLLPTGRASGQIREVTVGVTPTCPYGITACWAGAYGGLGCLDDVQSVDRIPDAYNCTAAVHLKRNILPEVEKWQQQFKSAVGDIYGFRGIELTIEATVESRDGVLLLRDTGLEQPITLAPLTDKVQWNFKKKRPRQAEPDEQESFDQLAVQLRAAEPDPLKVVVTGPFKSTDNRPLLQVREFFIVAP